jgi:hypothetical protein
MGSSLVVLWWGDSEVEAMPGPGVINDVCLDSIAGGDVVDGRDVENPAEQANSGVEVDKCDAVGHVDKIAVEGVEVPHEGLDVPTTGYLQPVATLGQAFGTDRARGVPRMSAVRTVLNDDVSVHQLFLVILFGGYAGRNIETERHAHTSAEFEK